MDLPTAGCPVEDSGSVLFPKPLLSMTGGNDLVSTCAPDPQAQASSERAWWWLYLAVIVLICIILYMVAWVTVLTRRLRAEINKSPDGPNLYTSPSGTKLHLNQVLQDPLQPKEGMAVL